MRLFTTFIILFMTLGLWTPIHAAEPSANHWFTGPGNLAFSTPGGMYSRFIIIESWDATTNWPVNTILKHDGHLWVALGDPGVGDEPGTAPVWMQATGGAGGGAAITAGTADPTGGSDGDAYIQVDASDVVQSLWRNDSGTWNEYTIPTAGTSTDDQTAAEVNTTTTDFDGYLSATDDSVQDALNTLDDAHRLYVATGTATQAGGAPNIVTAPVYPPFATVDLVLGATAIFKTPSTWVSSNVAITLGIGTSLHTALELADGDAITPADLEADAAYVVVYNGARWQMPGVLLEDNQVVLSNLIAGVRARLLPASPADDQIARYDTGTSAWVAEDLATVTANPGTRTTRLDNIMIGSDGYEIAPGSSIYITGTATYSEGDDTITAAVFGGWQPALGDAVLVPLPSTLGSSTTAINLEITYTGGRHDYPLLNFDGTAVNVAELIPGALIEAFYLLQGGLRRWILIEPTDLTEAEAGDSTSTRFGLVSGQRLRQAVAASSVLNLSDTPDTYTDQARRFTRVNVAETAIEFVDEPTNPNTIPHVGRLPEVADDSPVLVFLTHNEISGDREDATFDVARSGSQCGFSDGEIFNSFGSISKPSPIEMIFGVWDGTDSTCNLSTIHSINEGFIDDIRSIAYSAGGNTGTCNLGTRFQEFGHATKRILSCTDLSAVALGDITINFLYEDGIEAYWNDGSVENRAGLYEKVGTPVTYHDLAPPEDAHKTGEGSAACGDSEPPDAAGQICVTSDGRGYFAMPRTSLITTDATISVAGVGSDHFIPDLYEASDLQNRNNLNDGDFIYIKSTQEFYQFQDPNYEVLTWREAWQYVIDNVGDTPARQTFLTSIFLGEFASLNEVTRDRDGYTDGSIEYYFLYSDFGTLIHITAFTNSVRTTISEGFAWRGPVIIPEEVLDVVSANPSGTIDGVLDTVLIGSRHYNIIVRPGSNNILRDPTIVDWGLGSMAFDGTNAYRVRRDHPTTDPPTATYDEIYIGTILRFNGGNSEPGRDFRGVFHGDSDIHSPANGNVYINRDTRHWRIYLNGSWRDLDVSTIFFAAEDAEPYPWRGYHGSEYWAVRAVDDVNEYVAWGDSLYITESFDAGATTYEYHWENIVPDAPTLSSDDANLLSQLHELEAADATLTAGTIGTNVIGWTSSGTGEGSIDPGVPSGSDLIQISRVTTDETDTEIQNRLYVVAMEGSGEEKYDGAQFRLTDGDNFHLFQLEPLNYVGSDQRYVSTTTVPSDLHFDSGDDIEINIENPDSTNELTFGVPWLWHVPFSTEAGDSTGGGNILKAKYLVSSNTATDVDNTGWDTILTQAVTIAEATDRVYVDAVFTIQATVTGLQCNLRVARGTTLVGSAVEADFTTNDDSQEFSIRQIDTPGVGDHTYNVQVQSGDGTNECEVNEGGTSSFATIEVLAANP